MNESTIDVDLTEEEILIYKVSDETLEAAACGMKDKAGAFTLAFCSGAFTLAFCSGLDTCPA